MVAFSKVLRTLLVALLLVAGAGNAVALTCTSTQGGDWKDQIWSPAAGCNTKNAQGNRVGPPAGSVVIIAANTTVKIDSNTTIVADIIIDAGGTLTGKKNNTLSFSGNLTNNGGTFTANNGTVALTGVNQTITGNFAFANLTVSAGTQLTLAGNITVSGTLTGTLNIVPNTSCPPNAVFTITDATNTVVGNSCTGAGPYTGGGTTPATCNSLLPAMPVGGQAVASGGTTTIGAGTNVNGVPVTAVAGSNTILNPATTTTWNPGSAALPPPPSPIPTSTAITTVGAAGLAAGSYGDVRVSTGVRAFTGGNYFINELYVAPGATAQLAPGDYYLNKLTVGNGVTGGNITLSGNGLVRIFVSTNAKNDTILATGGSSGIWDGSTVNQGGNPANLQILLYPNVTYLEIGNNTQLTGFVVQPVYAGAAGAKAIDVHQGATITGGVYTAGLLNIKNNVTFNYTPQVASALTTMSSCTDVHHFEIQHASGSGVTCTPSTLTILACADGNVPCTPYTKGVSGTLSATGTPTVNWVGGTGFTIPAGSSSVTKEVQVTTVGTVVFDASSTPATTAATSCNFGTPSCTFTSASAAFIVSAPDHAADTASTLTIKAVQASPANPLVCAPGMTGAKTVNLKCAYSNPVSGTQAVLVAGTALNATNAAASACDAGGANVSLTFDTTGVATPTLQYADAGQMTISASFAGTAGTVDAGLAMSGTGSFIAAPASFSITNVTTGSIKAGNNFSATVSALNANGNVTPNFGKENLHLTAPNNIPEGVTLSSTLVGPAGGNNPALANGSVGGALFTNGVATVNTLNWSEVGDIKLNAALTSAGYLGSTQAPVGATTVASSFIPDHFDTQIVQTGVASAIVPMTCPAALACPANTVGASGMVYSGQPFTVKVSAMNLAGVVTTNFHNAYAQDVTLSGVGGAGALSNPLLTAGNFVASGVDAGTATTATLPAYTFTGAAPVAPTNITVHAVGSGVSAAIVSAGAGESGLTVVSGRIKVGNAYGSELLPLTVTANAQYFAGAAGWANSVTDSVTSLTIAATYNVVKAGVVQGTTVPTVVGPVSLAGGTVQIALGASGAGVTGAATVAPTAPAYLPLTPGTATFGVYKGGNQFIYQREAY